MTQDDIRAKVEEVLHLVNQGNDVAFEQAYDAMQDIMDDIQAEISEHNEDEVE